MISSEQQLNDEELIEQVGKEEGGKKGISTSELIKKQLNIN